MKRRFITISLLALTLTVVNFSCKEEETPQPVVVENTNDEKVAEESDTTKTEVKEEAAVANEETGKENVVEGKEVVVEENTETKEEGTAIGAVEVVVKEEGTEAGETIVEVEPKEEVGIVKEEPVHEGNVEEVVLVEEKEPVVEVGGSKEIIMLK